MSNQDSMWDIVDLTEEQLAEIHARFAEAAARGKARDEEKRRSLGITTSEWTGPGPYKHLTDWGNKPTAQDAK